jgi:hypothetical protein
MVSHQAIYKQAMLSLKSAHDETTSAQTEVEHEKKQNGLLKAKLAKIAADAQSMPMMIKERDDLKLLLLKSNEEEERLKGIIAPLEAKVAELTTSNTAITSERNTVLISFSSFLFISLMSFHC